MTQTPTSRKASMALATMIALAMGEGLAPGLTEIFVGGKDITREEKAYLKTLEAGARHIWTRRLMRGLSASERDFFNQKMADANEESVGLHQGAGVSGPAVSPRVSSEETQQS